MKLRHAAEITTSFSQTSKNESQILFAVRVLTGKCVASDASLPPNIKPQTLNQMSDGLAVRAKPPLSIMKPHGQATVHLFDRRRKHLMSGEGFLIPPPGGNTGLVDLAPGLLENIAQF
uniref:Uncharacterized protein n=1 Tax=Timema poppense TaxID=170557 RepID=A0A7R9GVY9_TIMPO|nr:unnamed protein product [Timema poppensis]